jgi:hypothetical protein
MTLRVHYALKRIGRFETYSLNEFCQVASVENIAIDTKWILPAGCPPDVVPPPLKKRTGAQELGKTVATV